MKQSQTTKYLKKFRIFKFCVLTACLKSAAVKRTIEDLLKYISYSFLFAADFYTGLKNLQNVKKKCNSRLLIEIN